MDTNEPSAAGAATSEDSQRYWRGPRFSLSRWERENGGGGPLRRFPSLCEVASWHWEFQSQPWIARIHTVHALESGGLNPREPVNPASSIRVCSCPLVV